MDEGGIDFIVVFFILNVTLHVALESLCIIGQINNLRPSMEIYLTVSLLFFMFSAINTQK